MKEFSTLVAEKWNIAKDVALETCICFENGDSPFFASDYNPLISVSLDLTTVSDIFVYLKQITDLAPKKKRVLNALAKANALNPELENRITHCIDSLELDDMLLPLRPNPRSRGQLALKKGLGPLVDIFMAQELEEGSIEELMEPYVNQGESFSSIEDVIANLKDILVERFAHEDTVRAMTRDFGYDDGFFEIIPKKGKEKEFARYRGKMIPVGEITPEQTLELLDAEQAKSIRFKHGVQLFRIAELLRHHFITNPDFIGFDLLCEVIDECWTRFLEPVVEKHVKDLVSKQAEDWALKEIANTVDEKMRSTTRSGAIFALGISADQDLVIVSLSPEGNLLGATKEKIRRLDKDFFCKRLQQFQARYKPVSIVIEEGEHAATAEAIAVKTLGKPDGLTIVYAPASGARTELAQSSWMLQKYGDLDDDMRRVYAVGIIYLQPFPLIPYIGISYFSLHPFQKAISPERIIECINRKTTQRKLHSGVPVVEAPGSVLEQLDGVTNELLQEIRRQAAKQAVVTKKDLLTVAGMTETIYRNIAGYIICSGSDNPLDHTTVHPSHFEWVMFLSQELAVSLDTLISNAEQLRSVKSDDFVKAVFVEQRLIPQLLVGESSAAMAATKPRKRIPLTEIEDGVIMQGRVTNITPFGVFIDINATCDGLVHISHLADGFVETADQVVSINDRVDVRVLAVDRKKKRISLSMKGLGDRGPKVRPSKGQLSTLADHFKNR
jgi:uncharacterized protein